MQSLKEYQTHWAGMETAARSGAFLADDGQIVPVKTPGACNLCDDGYPILMLLNGEWRHEAFGMSWRCQNDPEVQKRNAIEDKIRDQIANTGDC